MDIGFFTNAGTDTTWSLDECGTWAKENDFACVRLADTGAADTHRILDQGPDELRDGLAKHDIYLACLTAHCNLLDDDEARRQSEQERLLCAIAAAALLECPVVLTGSGAPVRNGTFYGMFSSPPGNPSDRCDELVARYKDMFTPVARHATTKGSESPWTWPCALAISAATRKCGTSCSTRCPTSPSAFPAIPPTGCGWGSCRPRM